jgi:4-hydroxybenzoate polyprenyltransferase
MTSRPVGWIASVGLYRIGLAYGEVRDSAATIVVSVALSWPFCLYLFGLNDLADAASDRLNPRKDSWIHGAADPIAQARWARAAPWVGGAVVAAASVTLPFRATAILLALLLLAWMYSSRPLRLKEVPIVDGIVTAAIMIGLLGAGYASGPALGHIPAESWAVAPALAGLHIYASVVDVASDKRAGHRTLAVRAGPRFATAVALAASVASAATVPLLDYAPAIALYMLFQPIVIAMAWAFPRWITPRRALAALGVAGVATLLYLLLVYLR